MKYYAITPKPVPTTHVLELTDDEASLVKAVMGRISGDQSDPTRILAGQIYNSIPVGDKDATFDASARYRVLNLK